MKPLLTGLLIFTTALAAEPDRYAMRKAELEKTLPTGFTVVLAPPFVVAGDEEPATVRAHAKRTVEWAVAALKKDFFANDPAEVITIWLFAGKESYEKNTKDMFGTAPTSPYGYYSAADRALIMNISTGGGTLVHEIVHPFMRTNFPECPAWFNEGMGSLFEQSREVGGHIRGLTNWRLAGLQEAIRDGKTISFEKLTALSDTAFYGDDRGTHYAQARYLCYYLQEAGLLRKFYRDFLANRAKDPTGYQTLRAVLGDKDMAEFQQQWESDMLKLRFP